jgi:hypothetical protein
MAAITVTGCSDTPSHATMQSLLVEQAAFPECPAAEVSFIDRDPGGGFLGGWINVRVEAPPACAAVWRRRLESICGRDGAEFHCEAADQNTGGDVRFQGASTAVVRLWSVS